MSESSPITTYVRDALRAGQTKQAIAQALSAAGWTKSEVAAALAAWTESGETGPVPRPVRAQSARDALFYGLLFIAFGMVAGNALALILGQINIWLPETRQYPGRGTDGLRWSMAAIIVFTPVFWWLDRTDRQAQSADPARQHGFVRRWLSAVAMLFAVVSLLGNALFVIYTYLDGAMTARFLAKSAAVAGMSLVVLGYFRQAGEDGAKRPGVTRWALIGTAALALGLAFWTVGGPAQGRAEQRDVWRVSDMRTLANDILSCDLANEPLPETLDPLRCASNPDRMTAMARDITYRRLSGTEFELCTRLEAPEHARTYGLRLTGNTLCQRGEIR